MVGRVTSSAAQPMAELPDWITLVRAPNPGPMTLEGTNTWVIPLPGGNLVIDPGPLDEDHLAAVAGQGPVAAALLTHGHPDHRDGLDRFRQLTGARLADGAELVTDGIRVRRMPTPGHTSDSVCFVVERGGERVIFTGDTILGRGTTVVAYPDGDLGEYLASLRRLAEVGAVPVLPGHGPALSDCAAAASFYLEHRLARLEQVRAARAAGARTPEEVVAVVYADVDHSLWPAATSSVLAQLAYLDSGGPDSSLDSGGAAWESAPGPPRLDSA